VTLQANQRVRITGDLTAGSVVGRVEDIRSVDEMPAAAELGVFDLPAGGEFEPRAIMREMGVEHVAAISYHTAPNAELLFTALEIGGEWFDLKRQRLTIEVIGVFG
jgi:hypothetical protein